MRPNLCFGQQWQFLKVGHSSEIPIGIETCLSESLFVKGYSFFRTDEGLLQPSQDIGLPLLQWPEPGRRKESAIDPISMQPRYRPDLLFMHSSKAASGV